MKELPQKKEVLAQLEEAYAEAVHHHGPLGHAGAAWCSHGNRVPEIWCRSLWSSC